MCLDITVFDICIFVDIAQSSHRKKKQEMNRNAKCNLHCAERLKFQRVFSLAAFVFEVQSAGWKPKDSMQPAF